MANKASRAILKAKIEGIITEMLVKTTADMVYLEESGTVTVAAKIAELVAAVNERAKTTDMETAISTAVSGLKSELMGEGVPEALDTFKEIADCLESNKEVADALNAAIGTKADKTVVESLQKTINELGSLATKSTVSEMDLDDALKEKVNSAAEGNHSHANKNVLDGITDTKVNNWDDAAAAKHTHDNKAVLDGITGDDVIEWNSKGSIFVSKTEPENLEEGDLWFGLVD